jgi:repressor LexA
MLTPGQRTILQYIQAEQRSKGLTPSTREIQEHFGFASQTSVMQYLAALERKGVLQRHARKARALITAAPHSRVVDIPIYGEIPAGMATLAEQNIEGHVRGDSMLGAHILDGDVVILEDRQTAKNGDIVAALIDGETTLKRYVKERGRPYLKAENPQFPDLIPARELRIQGVMTSLVRKQRGGSSSASPGAV